MQALAQVDGGIVDADPVCLGPQLQGVAGATAFEAMEHMLLQVG